MDRGCGLNVRILFGLMLCGTLIAGFSREARAGDVKIKFVNVAKGGSTTMMLDTNGDSSYDTSLSGGGGLMTFYLSDDDYAGSDVIDLPQIAEGTNFHGFCIEFFEHANSSLHDYAVVDPSAAPVAERRAAARWGPMARRPSRVSSRTPTWATIRRIGPNSQALAFQLAVWEIVYEYSLDNSFSAGSLNVNSGRATFTGIGSERPSPPTRCSRGSTCRDRWPMSVLSRTTRTRTTPSWCRSRRPRSWVCCSSAESASSRGAVGGWRPS